MDLEKELEHRSAYLAGGQHALLMSLRLIISVLTEDQRVRLLALLDTNLEPIKVGLLNSSQHEDYISQFEHIYTKVIGFTKQ